MAWNETHWPADGSLPDYVSEYVDWLIALDKQPATKVQWAREHNRHLSVLARWEKDDRVRREIDRRASDYNMHPAQIQAVLNAVMKAAQAGDMNAAKLYLQHVDKLAPKRVVVEDRRLSDMTDEELQAEMVRLDLVP